MDDNFVSGIMAGTTGLEPATSDVTGRRSNQLNYVPLFEQNVRHTQDNISPRFDSFCHLIPSGNPYDFFRLGNAHS